MSRVRQYPEESPTADLERRLGILERSPRSGIWRDWTPDYANIILGNGGEMARYVQGISGLVVVRFQFTLGTESSIGSNPSISLPVTASSVGDTAALNTIGNAIFKDDSGGTRHGHVRLQSTTTWRPTVYIVTGGQIGESSLNATVPHPWDVNDHFYCSFFYEGA